MIHLIRAVPVYMEEYLKETSQYGKVTALQL